MSELSARPAMRRRIGLALLLMGLLAFGISACKKNEPETAHVHETSSSYFTCPMHPQIVRDGPGKCPICSMDLVKVTRPATPRAGSPTVAPEGQSMADEDSARAEVMLSEQQIQLANIRVATLGLGEQTGRTVLTGRVTTDATRTHTVSSRVRGRVERLFVRQTGESLRRGAPLVSIYSEELQALQQEYLLSLAQERAMRGTANDYGRLVESAGQRLRLLGLSAAQLRTIAATGRPTPSVTFYSPDAGVVQTVGVTEGQYVGEGSLLVSLTNLSSLWVEAQLYPEEVADIRPGQSVKVQVAGLVGDFTGKVVFLSPEQQADSRVTLLRVQLANTDGHLRPGMQANVILAGMSPSSVLTVPQGAVLRDSRGSYMWQQLDSTRFRRLKVTTGTETDASVTITGGIAAGARLVVSGAYLLESEYALYQGTGGMDPNMPGMEKTAPPMDPNMKM